MALKHFSSFRFLFRVDSCDFVVSGFSAIQDLLPSGLLPFCVLSVFKRW